MAAAGVSAGFETKQIKRPGSAVGGFTALDFETFLAGGFKGITVIVPMEIIPSTQDPLELSILAGNELYNHRILRYFGRQRQNLRKGDAVAYHHMMGDGQHHHCIETLLRPRQE